MGDVIDSFNLEGRVAVITGGAGLLGVKHAEAVAELGGHPVLADIDELRAKEAAKGIEKQFARKCLAIKTDITSKESIAHLKNKVLDEFSKVDILINNAANNPKVDSDGIGGGQWSRLENFPLHVWNQDIAVGLTGAFLCSQAFLPEMARNGKGVVLNISSDLGLIAPDQRPYKKDGLADEEQPVKPVTYSVVKSGLIGLTRYLATYWANKGIRANVLAPGGVYVDQEPAFVEELTKLIPMGRMAERDEYKAAVAFLISDASSYMNGAVVAIDGGRTCW